MANNRLPPDKAKVSGAAMKNPGRYAGNGEAREANPIGAPYPTMTAAEIAVWNECSGSMPWLHAGHRVLLRLVCKLAARMDEGELGVQATSVLSGLLSKLGATPVDESRVFHANPDDDPDEEFFSKRTH